MIIRFIKTKTTHCHASDSGIKPSKLVFFFYKINVPFRLLFTGHKLK